MLGSFYPFMRNHNELGALSQEAYRWSSVAEASRRAIAIRYRMLDYFYTAFYEQTLDGTPSINPLFNLYPEDKNTFGIDLQFFFGSAVLISPVTQENSTSVQVYIPDDIFYDWNNGFAVVRGSGAMVALENIDYQTIPIHIRGGTIVPLRVQSANTTTELRKQNFEILIAPGLDGTANGTLYIDDGISLNQQGTTYLSLTFNGSTLSVIGSYGYVSGVNISQITVVGVTAPQSVTWNGNQLVTAYNASRQVVRVSAAIPMTANTTVSFGQLRAYTGAASCHNSGAATLTATLVVIFSFIVCQYL